MRGEWRTNHRFVAHNAALVDEVRALEDRVRRRDLLVEGDWRCSTCSTPGSATTSTSGRDFDTLVAGGPA